MTSDPTNADRAARPEAPIAVYRKGRNYDSPEELLIDLIADLGHWADAHDICFVDAMEAAMLHHGSERRDQGAS